MVKRREIDLEKIGKYDLEWREIARYYETKTQKELVEFLYRHPEVGQYFRRLMVNQPTSDLILLKEIMDQFADTKKLLKEVWETGPMADLDIPWVFGDEKLAERFIEHMKKVDAEEFQKYRESYSNEWQMDWFSSLGEMQKNLIKIRLRDFPKNGLFLINAYLSEFERFHQIILNPFLKSVINPEENTYQERLEWFLDCIHELHIADEYRDSMNMLLEDLLDKDLRNSIAKHNYLIDQKNSMIRYFTPDAIVRKYREKGEITNKGLLQKTIALKVVFWILISEIYKKNDQYEELESIIGDFKDLRGIFTSFLSLNGLEVLEAIVHNYRKINHGIKEYCEENISEILKHQLKESWISLRLFVLAYFDLSKVSDQELLGEFSVQDQVILMNMHMKSFYLLNYEEMMQTIVHPMGEIINKNLSKKGALNKLRSIENRTFEPLFSGLHPDLRDSLAHNTYYYDGDNNQWLYYKFGDQIPPNQHMEPFTVFYNYHNLINAVFPGLLEISDDLAIAQAIIDITKKDNLQDPSFWEKREKLLLHNNLTYWGAICCIKKALWHCQMDRPEVASKVLGKLDQGAYQELSILEYESLIGWVMLHYANPKLQTIPKFLAKRVLKRMKGDSEDKVIKRRVLFVLLFSSMKTRSFEEIKRIEKQLVKLDDE